MTTLTVTPNMVQAGQVVTLTSSTCAMLSGCIPVTGGTVTFVSGTQLLGTVQVKSADGTATLKTRFAPGSYTLSAQYNGTNQDAKSISAPQPLIVTGTEPTISTLSAVPNGSNYDFTLNVFGYGYPAPTGTASLDETSQQIHLGDFSLGQPGAVAFQAPVLYSVGSLNYGIAVGDFNGDGFPDIAVTDNNANTVTVLLGNGDGTFNQLQPFTVDFQPSGITVGDFNADGNLDIAVATTFKVDVLFGNGDGTFQPKGAYSFDSPWSLAVGDFNNDGTPDLAVCSSGNSVAVFTNNGDGTFTQQPLVTAGSALTSIGVGDFNGDGNLDVVVADSTGTNVFVLLGDGLGGLGTPAPFPAGQNPYTVVVADFNNDAKADLAVSNRANPGTVTVLLGNGNGTFQTPKMFPVNIGAYGLATADWNGDNIPDLAVSNGGNTIGILLGNGDGTFQTQQVYDSAVGTSPIAAADLNGDGVPDVPGTSLSGALGILIAGTSTTAQLTNIAVLGQGTQTVQSTYSPNTQFYTGGNSNSLQLTGTQLATTTTVTSNINPSQYLQQVTFTATVTATNNGSPTGTVAFSSDVQGGLCTATLTTISGGSVATCVVSLNVVENHIITAAYSGDNNYLPSSGALIQIVNQATTTTALAANPPNQQVFGQPVTITATVTGAFGGAPTGTVDFADGIHEISLCLGVPLVNGVASCQTSALPLGQDDILASYSGDANFMPNNAFLPYKIVGANSATTLSLNPPSPIVAGQVETLTATVTSNNQPVTAGTVTFFNGTQPLGTVQIAIYGGAATATLKTRFAPGSDTLTAHYNGTNQIGISTSPPQPLIVTGTEPTISTLAATPDGGNYDFTLSVFGLGFAAPTGKASLDERSLNIHLGDFSLAGPGALAFQAPVTYQAGNYNSAIAAGDFNGDGIPDLAVSNTNDNTVSVFLGKGDGTFGAQVTVPVDSKPFGIVTGDFNSDGNLDIAVAADSGSGIDILLGNGDGTFQPKQLYSFANAYGLAVGDFNGDGFPDLVVINTNSVGVLLNSGNGAFSSGGTIQIGTFLQSPAVGDFNSDGNLDVAVLDSLGNDVIVLLGDGMGGFLGNPQTFPVGPKPFGLAVGDLNHDGKLDVAVTNSDNTVSVLLGSIETLFQPQQTYPVGQSPTGVAIADWNGDGIPDLAIANFSFSTVSLLLGSGDGTFQPQQVFMAAQQPASLIALDLNGDGVPDLAAPNETFNSIGVLLGGTSTAAQLTNIAVPGQGQETVQATYAPDANAPLYKGSMSNVVTVTGSPNSTVTTLTADFNPSGITEAVTFTATVQGASGSPTGTVTFTVDGANLCAAVPLQPLTNAGFATCATSSLSIGSYTIVATYSGDSFYLPSMSMPLTEMVGKITNYIVALSVQAVDQGNSIMLTASVEPQHCDLVCIPPAQVVPTGTVTFGTSPNDLTSLGTAQLNSQAMASITVTNPGSLSVVYAHYLGDANFYPATSTSQQDPDAPLLVVQSATTSPGALLSVALNLTIDFRPGTNYFKQITCNAPIALGITCTPNPAIITSNAQANVDIMTSGGIAYLRTPGIFGGDAHRWLALMTQLGTLGAVWLGFAPRRQRRGKRIAGILLVLLACSPILMTSCGGFAPAVPPGGSSSATPPGTYFITGTATLYQKAAAQAGGNLQIGTPQSFLIQLLVK